MAAKTNLRRRIVAAGILGLSVTLRMGAAGHAHAAGTPPTPQPLNHHWKMVGLSADGHKWTGVHVDPGHGTGARPDAMSVSADSTGTGVQPFSHRWR